MSSKNRMLEALISQNRPVLHTRKGLIIIGLQNDFVASDGKLPVSISEGFWPALKTLIPAFRELGEVVWVRSEFDGTPSQSAIIGSSGKVEYDDEFAGNVQCEYNGDDKKDGNEDGDENGNEGGGDSPVPIKRRRTSNDESESTPTLDAIERATTPEASSSRSLPKESPASKCCSRIVNEEFFLSQTPGKEPCCIPDSHGAEFCCDAKALLDEVYDLQITMTSYSAFGTGPLLMKLRSKLVTELFICGCPANSSIYATALEAAQNGFEVNLIEDCLASKTEFLKEAAVAQLCDILEADAVTAAETLEIIRDPRAKEQRPYQPDVEYEYDEEEEDELEADDEDDGEHVSADGIEKEFQGLRGGGDTLIFDDNSSVSAQSLGDAAGDVSPMLVSALPLPPHLGDGLQGLHVSPVSANNSNVSEADTSCQDGASHVTQPGPPNGAVEDIVIDESNCAQPVEGSRSTASNNDNDKEPLAVQLQDTSTPIALPNSDSPKTDVYRFMERSKHSRQIPTATSKDRRLNAIASLCRLPQKTVDHYETMMKQARNRRAQPLFGEGKETESNGSTILHGLLPLEAAQTVFNSLKDEISWQRMYHQTGEVPRLVCCQGSIAEDGSRPVYRHPSDQTLPSQPWTATVDLIRKAAEDEVGHPLNHALIQFYRTGTDYISEHSDKTLDITKGTNIVNVSVGAQRTMRLRTKRTRDADALQGPSERTTHRVPMPHNSMIKMTMETNAEYLHSINADKRPAVELSAAETAYDGGRISLTFRSIGTFCNADSTLIWGQGATGKTADIACPVVNGDKAESEQLIRAFGVENQATSLQWDATYGAGSDVLHLKTLAAVAGSDL